MRDAAERGASILPRTRLISARREGDLWCATLLDTITGRMREISTYTSAVAVSVEQQNAATGEISQNVAGAAQGTGMVVSVLGEVAGAATATRTSAETVLTASQSVEGAVSRLRDEVETFLGKVAL